MSGRNRVNDFPNIFSVSKIVNLLQSFFFLQQGKQGLVRSNIVVTLGIKREITIYMSLIALVKGSSQYCPY